MREREFIRENLRSIVISRQVDQILHTIVTHYTNPNQKSKTDAQAIGRRYAISQRDYWDNNLEVSDAKALRQIWTDALVKVATENDWGNIKRAIEFDIIDLNESATQLGKKRAVALSNLTKLL